MSEVSLFGKKSSALSTSLADIPDFSSTITGGGDTGSTNRRISIKGKEFRQFINGKEYHVSEDRTMNVVVVRPAPIHRIFFAENFSEGKTAKPTCWSSDSRTPDESVPQDQKQAERCMDCTQNIKGSGGGNGRACKFKQRLAVMLEGDLHKKEIYQIELPATSVFGEGEKDKMPLQAYGKYLKAHNTNIITVVTEMKFDSSVATPKLNFKAIRPLEDEEQQTVLDMLDHPDTMRAVTLTVPQMDKVTPEPKEAPKIEAAPVKAEVAVEESAEEPKKVVKKSAPAPSGEPADLSAIVDNWDD